MDMANLFFLVLPIFLIILLGKIIQLKFVTDLASWNGLNKITYWLLFPCLLFYMTSTIDLNNLSLFGYSASLLIGFVLAVLAAYCFGKMCKADAPSLTSVIQGAGRHNTFIALAVVAQVFGESGTEIGTIATAVLVPFSNIVMIVSLSLMLNKSRDKKVNILFELIRNPIIVSIAFGLAINYLGWSQDPVFYELTGMLGKATLPVVLLCIGAGLQFSGLRNQVIPCVISCLSKMVLFPGVTYFIAVYVGLSESMTIIAVIFAIGPTSPAGFPLAKQMGGDAPLMASIISLQTTLSLLVIPLSIVLMQA